MTKAPDLGAPGPFLFAPDGEWGGERRRGGAPGSCLGDFKLAALGLMRGVEIGDAAWCDIDTLSDLVAAESALTTPSA